MSLITSSNPEGSLESQTTTSFTSSHGAPPSGASSVPDPSYILCSQESASMPVFQ